MTIRLHPELEGNDGFAHLFTVKPGHSEETNIGKICRFIHPSCVVEQWTFVIGSLQYDYAGRLCYRVYHLGGTTDTGEVFQPDTFGRVAHFDEIEIIG